MPFFRRKKKSAYQNILELTPYRIYTHKITEDGMVAVQIPRFHNKILAKILNPRLKDPYVNVNFDEFGSGTWLEIDGQKNVLSICSGLVNKFGDKIQPVNERVSKFLNQLYLYKFINFNEMKGEE